MVGVGTANLGGRYPGPMLASLLARLLCAPTRSGASRQGSRPPQSPFTGCPSPVAPSPNGLGDDLITEGATCGTAGPLSNGNGAGTRESAIHTCPAHTIALDQLAEAPQVSSTTCQVSSTNPQDPSPALQIGPATHGISLVPVVSQTGPWPAFTLIHYGPESMIWDIGVARMRIMDLPLHHFGTGHRHLEYVQSKGDLGFLTPPILFKEEIDGRLYVLTGNLPGSYLGDVWHTLQPAAKDYYVEQTANMIQKLSELQSEELCAFDKSQVREHYMNTVLDVGVPSATNEELTRLAKTWDMDCSSFHFYVNNLSPWNIIVNGTDNPIGVAHWGMAGFYPKAWARTKLSMLLDADLESTRESDAGIRKSRHAVRTSDTPELRSSLRQKLVQRMEERQEWRALLQRRLGEKGFPESSVEYQRHILDQLSPGMAKPKMLSPLVEYLPKGLTSPGV
ncbi:uncharacterized protein AUP68_08123 [Ilyonectria robusta]